MLPLRTEAGKQTPGDLDFIWGCEPDFLFLRSGQGKHRDEVRLPCHCMEMPHNPLEPPALLQRLGWGAGEARWQRGLEDTHSRWAVAQGADRGQWRTPRRPHRTEDRSLGQTGPRRAAAQKPCHSRSRHCVGSVLRESRTLACPRQSAERLSGCCTAHRPQLSGPGRSRRAVPPRE